MSDLYRNPNNWNSIIGHDKALRMLRALLSDVRRIPDCFIIDGPYGVGKKSVARLLARSISCGKFDGPYNEDNKIVELDTGLQIEDIESSINSNEIVILSLRNKLDDKLASLIVELIDKNEHKFIIITRDFYNIPKDLRSISFRLRLGILKDEDINGYLTNLCSTLKIEYTQDGLREITKKAKGNLKEAIKIFDLVNRLGPLNRETVRDCYIDEYEDSLYKILIYIGGKKIKEAQTLIRDIVRDKGSVYVIDELFSLYSKCIFDVEEETETISMYKKAIRESLYDHSKISSIFLKWNTGICIPVDALSIFIMELSSVCKKDIKVREIKDEIQPMKTEEKKTVDTRSEQQSATVRDLMELSQGKIQVIGKI